MQDLNPKWQFAGYLWLQQWGRLGDGSWVVTASASLFCLSSRSAVACEPFNIRFQSLILGPLKKSSPLRPYPQ
jgi:hypothetical protein